MIIGGKFFCSSLETSKGMCGLQQNNKDNTQATMKDVALAAGVSTATVSRTLMNPEKVSSQTRQKVEQAVLDVGYYPHNLR